MKLHKITFALLFIGGLNWGLYAFGWDLEQWLPLGTTAYNVIYVVVGLSALWELWGHKRNCKVCGG